MTKYRAYKPFQATDGLLVWTQHYFDNTVEWTEADCEMFIATSTDALAPEERIKRLQGNLDGLRNITPVIQVHIDEIRAILARMENHFCLKNQHEADELGSAEMLWQKILVLRDVVPLAKRGVTFTRKKSPGAIGETSKFIQQVVMKHRHLSAKEMLFAAIAEARAHNNCPLDFTDAPEPGDFLDYDTEVCWDIGRDCGKNFKWFEKAVSKARKALGLKKSGGNSTSR